MRYNVEFRKLTLITRPQSIEKSKQISGQTILSSPQDLILRKIATLQWLKMRYMVCYASGVNNRYTLNILFNDGHLPNSSIQYILHLSIHLSYLEESFCFDTIHVYSTELPKGRLFWATCPPKKQTLNKYSGVFYLCKHPSKGINTLNLRRREPILTN